jgi:uncharacterized protein HemX
MSKKTNSNKKTLIAAASIAAVAATAAGVYFFGTKQGVKDRKKIGAWAVSAKKEVIKEFKKGEKVSKKAYHDVIKQVMAKYSDVKNIDPSEVKATIAELQKHWKGIEKDVKKHVVAATKVVATVKGKKGKK